MHWFFSNILYLFIHSFLAHFFVLFNNLFPPLADLSLATTPSKYLIGSYFRWNLLWVYNKKLARDRDREESAAKNFENVISRAEAEPTSGLQALRCVVTSKGEQWIQQFYFSSLIFKKNMRMISAHTPFAFRIFAITIYTIFTHCESSTSLRYLSAVGSLKWKQFHIIYTEKEKRTERTKHKLHILIFLFSLEHRSALFAHFPFRAAFELQYFHIVLSLPLPEVFIPPFALHPAILYSHFFGSSMTLCHFFVL